MKQILLRALRALIYPLVWCRRTILEASEICWDSDPIGCTDYMTFRSRETPRVTRCTIVPRKEHPWKSVFHVHCATRA